MPGKLTLFFILSFERIKFCNFCKTCIKITRDKIIRTQQLQSNYRYFILTKISYHFFSFLSKCSTNQLTYFLFTWACAVHEETLQVTATYQNVHLVSCVPSDVNTGRNCVTEDIENTSLSTPSDLADPNFCWVNIPGLKVLVHDNHEPTRCGYGLGETSR